MRLTIAIDGPAGAGKSTIAKIIAEKYNLMYINTGAMYRAITYKALKENIPSNNIENLVSMIESLSMCFINDRLILNGEDINDIITLPEISSRVSEYSSVFEVREKLVELQRDMAKEYDVIMDGRDIGTVVLDKATYKFFLTASPEERAERRYEELIKRGIKVDYEEILKDMIQRDYLDTHREVAPLKMATDAIKIDTTGLNIEEVVKKICSYINEDLKVKKGDAQCQK